MGGQAGALSCGAKQRTTVNESCDTESGVDHVFPARLASKIFTHLCPFQCPTNRGRSLTTNRSREYDGNQRRSVYFHRTASSGWDRTCWSICFNLWSRCACLSDTTDSKVKYNKIKGKQMQVHANPKCCTAEFRRGSGRSPVLSLDAINADRQVLRACSENW